MGKLKDDFYDMMPLEEPTELEIEKMCRSALLSDIKAITSELNEMIDGSRYQKKALTIEAVIDIKLALIKLLDTYWP